jgi:hypothetical protein
MKVPAVLLAGAFLVGVPALAGSLNKTDLPPGEYEYLGNGANIKTTQFIILSDGTAILKTRSWVQSDQKFPLSSLKAGLYKKLHVKSTQSEPGDEFEILADGTLKLDSSIEDGPSPFEEKPRISQAANAKQQ